MSYILDALRKLEQNRLHEEAVTFLAFQGQKPDKPRRRLLWVYLLIAALLANAGVAGWWIGFRSPTRAPLSGMPRTAPEAGPAGAAAPAPAIERGETRAQGQDGSPRPATEPSRAAGRGIKAGQPATGPASAVRKPPAAGQTSFDKPSQDPRGKSTAQQPPLPQAPAPAQASLAKPPADRRSPAPGQASAPQQPAGAKAVPAAPENPSPDLRTREATPPPPADGRVLKPGDLPPALAAHLPPLKVSLHYYIGDPQSRFVLIDDRLLREEQYLSEGLKVEQINQTDVVMNYRGWRFQIGLDEGR